MSKRRRKLKKITDDIVVDAIDRFGPRAMTYVIANVLNRKWPTAQIRRHLENMEKRGLVERVNSAYAVQICWSLRASNPPPLPEGAP